MEWSTIPGFKYSLCKRCSLIVASGLEPTSQITDIQFLPLSSDHKGNNVLSSDRVILLMGNIQLPGFGNVSGVLYDGTSYQPYILSTKADGSSGIIYTLFSEHSQSFSAHGISFSRTFELM